MEYKNLITNRLGRTQRIIINRPDQLNALNLSTLKELKVALIAADADKNVRGIIITGMGEKAFIAGADIKEFRNFTRAQAKAMSEQGQANVFNLIHDLSKPVVAAINGYALGGGLELALACHLRSASTNALLGLPEVSLGLIPGYGGTQRLTNLIGRGRALEIILTGTPVSAKTAFEYGLVNLITEHEDLLDKTAELLEKIYTRSPNAIAHAIHAVNSADRPEVNGYEEETNAFADCFGTPDFIEGVNAFLEKRKPEF